MIFKRFKGYSGASNYYRLMLLAVLMLKLKCKYKNNMLLRIDDDLTDGLWEVIHNLQKELERSYTANRKLQEEVLKVLYKIDDALSQSLD
jgi:hypothetical protein